jgi:hypothetical protein
MGGFAYSWQDKKDEIATWFGITDYKGRLKPAYYALQRAWKDRSIQQPMTWFYIEGPSEVEKGKKYRYKVRKEYEGDFNYEWYLQKENLSGMYGKLEEVGDEKILYMEIPEEEGELRLYVFVSDGEGNVVTASYPLLVK